MEIACMNKNLGTRVWPPLCSTPIETFS